MSAPIILLLASAAVLAASAARLTSSDYEPSFGDYYDRDAEQIIYGPLLKRNECTSRGGNCDSSESVCCPGTACRCNLWGANCKCQRKGLFTKLG